MSASDSGRVMARAQGLLFLCGATVGAISVLLPHARGADDIGLWSNIGLAYIGAAGTLLLGHRLPRWAFHAILATGTVLITRAIYLSDDPGSYYASWYLWVGLYAFFFFSRAQATAHVSLIAVCYALVLAHDPGNSAAGRWVTTVTTLLVAGVFTSVLVRRVRLRAAESARDAANLSAVAEVAHRLSGETDGGATRRAICEAAMSITEGHSVALWEPTADSSGLAMTAGIGEPAGADMVHFVAGRSGMTSAFSSGESVFVADLDAASETTRSAVGAQAASCLFEPVLRNDVPVAVLAIGWSKPVASLTESVAAVLALLAGEAGAAMERADLLARLEAVARTDDLTGLRNRRGWEEELPRELARAQRDGVPVSVAMLDLDHFKRFNDERGHQAGDRLLKQAASAWSERLRVIDVLARYGGEEFALALPGCRLEDALALVDSLRSATPGGQTCSAGVACWDGSEGPEEVLGRADRALYAAKRAGRDRTVGAEPSQLRAASG